jgi:hypothetical protein
MQKIIWTRRVKIEVLHRVKEERNILHTIKKRKADRIGYILHRDGLLKHVVEGTLERTEVTGIRGRILKHLLDEFWEMNECWKMHEEALDRTL